MADNKISMLEKLIKKQENGGKANFKEVASVLKTLGPIASELKLTSPQIMEYLSDIAGLGMEENGLGVNFIIESGVNFDAPEMNEAELLDFHNKVWIDNRLKLGELNCVKEGAEKAAKKNAADNAKKALSDACSDIIKNIISNIKQYYDVLLAPGYDVYEPTGLLVMCGYGTYENLPVLVRLKGNGSGKKVTECDAGSAYRKLYTLMASALDLKQSNCRVYGTEQLTGSDANYYPYVLMQYVYGSCNAEDKEATDVTGELIYSRHSAATDFNDYFTSVIAGKDSNDEGLYKILTRIMYGMAGNISPETGGLAGAVARAEEGLSRAAGKITRALSNCLLVWEADAGRIRLRFADTSCIGSDGVISASNSKFNDPMYCDRLLKEAEDAAGVMEKDRNICYITRLEGDMHVIEMDLIRDESKCGLLPMFAIKALNTLQAREQSVSWNNIIMGQSLSGRIITANKKESLIKFGQGTAGDAFLHITAGSRWGKGVTTLNLLAAAMGDGIPVFYLDDKPDMAIKLREMAPGYKTFAVNGAKWAAEFDPNGMFGASNKCGMPGFVVPPFNTAADRAYAMNAGDWAALRYFKALMLCISLGASIGGGEHLNYSDMADMYGKKQFVCIIDELTNASYEISGTINKLKYLAEDLRMKRDDLEKEAKRTKTEVDTSKLTDERNYYLNLLAWYKNCLAQLNSMNKYAINGKPISMIAIYQGLGRVPSDGTIIAMGNNQYEGVNSSNGAISAKGEMIAPPVEPMGMKYTTLFKTLVETFGKRGLIGGNLPNKESREYIQGTEDGHKYLSTTNRNFAYVDDIFDEMGGKGPVFFKPFLILNDNVKGTKSVDQMIQNIQVAGEKPEVILEEYLEPDGNFVPGVGLEGYLTAMGADYKTVLGNSYALATAYVRHIGYNGDCFDYISDFRVESLGTTEDMYRAFGTMNANYFNALRNSVKTEEELVACDDEDLTADEFDGTADFNAGAYSNHSNNSYSEAGDEEEYYDEFNVDLDDEDEELADGTSTGRYEAALMHELERTSESGSDTEFEIEQPKEYGVAREIRYNDDYAPIVKSNDRAVVTENGNKVVIDTARVLDPRTVTKLTTGKSGNSIRCFDRAPSVKEFRKAMRNDATYSRFLNKSFKGMLMDIADGVGGRMSVEVVSVAADRFIVNGKMVIHPLMSSIQVDCMVDLMDFPMMLSTFSNIKKLTLDRTMLGVFEEQIGDCITAKDVESGITDSLEYALKHRKKLNTIVVVANGKIIDEKRKSDMLKKERNARMELLQEKARLREEKELGDTFGEVRRARGISSKPKRVTKMSTNSKRMKSGSSGVINVFSKSIRGIGKFFWKLSAHI